MIRTTTAPIIAEWARKPNQSDRNGSSSSRARIAASAPGIRAAATETGRRTAFSSWRTAPGSRSRPHCCQGADLRGKTVGVFGCGTIGLFVIMTAKAMGGSIAEAFPWSDYETCLEQTLAEKWDALMEEGVWVETDVDTISDDIRLAGIDAPAVQAEGDVNSFPLLLLTHK